MKKGALDYLGYGAAALVVGLMVYALLYLLWFNPFYQAGSYGGWDSEAWGRHTEEGEERFTDPIRSLSVDNIGGSVVIQGWDQSFLRVKYVKSAPSQEHLENLEVTIDKSDNRLSLRRTSKTSRSRGSVSFEIWAPRGLTTVAAESVSGNIQLLEMGSDVSQKLSTISGSIFTDNSADLSVHSVSGSVECSFSGANLKADTTSGRITARIMRVEPRGSVEINSVSGSVNIYVFPELDADANIRTVSGSIDSEIPIALTSTKRNRLEGTIGEGGLPFSISTVSGSIRIKKL